MHTLKFLPLFLSVFSCSVVAQTNSLPYRPVAAEYSEQLDRIILVSENPNSLHIYNPANNQNQSVPLSHAPLSLAITPDKVHAVIGHDRFITYVDLQKRTVISVHEIPDTAPVVTASDSWAYVISSRTSQSTFSINLQTGEIISSHRNVTAATARFNSSTSSIYGTKDGIYPNDIWEFHVEGGKISSEGIPVYFGNVCVQGLLWFSSDEKRIYNGCGTVFHASQNLSLDRHYFSSIPNTKDIAAFAESEKLKRIAVIETDTSYSENSINSDKIKVFNNQYFSPTGEFVLPQTVVGGNSFSSKGKWIFFNSASTSLHIIMQVDERSGLLDNFVTHTVPMDTPQHCGASFSSTSMSINWTNQSHSIEVKAPSSCVHLAYTNDPWIQIPAGLGAGDTNLSFITQTNPNPSMRTGRIMVGNSILIIHQQGASATGNVSILGYNVIDAEYSKQTDKIILTSDHPDQLIIYSPSDKSERTVALVQKPVSLSVYPDGSYAAVGHDGLISYVNLKTATIEKVFEILTDANKLILAPNGYIYIYPRGNSSNFFNLEISSGKITPTPTYSQAQIPRLTNSWKYIYTGGGFSFKWDIREGRAKLSRSFNSYTELNSCGNVWLSEDDRRIFSACGKAFLASEIPSEDGKPNGSLSQSQGGVQWVSHSAQRKLIAVIPNTSQTTGGFEKAPDNNQIQFYDDAYLNFTGAVPLPPLVTNAGNTHGRGAFIFWNRNATGVFVILKSNESQNTWGITEVNPSSSLQPSIINVTNGASFLPGFVTPGELITIFGNGLGPEKGTSFSLDPLTKKVGTHLAGTEVYINGIAVPVLYTSSNQINTIAPFYTNYHQDFSIQVSNQGVLTKTVKIAMSETSPAIFTLNGSGSGQAAALNLDGTIPDSTNPAIRGSYVSLYITGGGRTSYFDEVGSVNGPQLNRFLYPVSVTVGGMPTTVTFAGAAPGLVTGVGQINIKLADNTPTGDSQPVIVTVGNTSSKAQVSIAVK